MQEGKVLPRDAGARQSFGDIAREVVGAGGGGSFDAEGLTLSTQFQPIYSTERGTAIGVEALVRAHSADDARPLGARAVFAARDRAGSVRFDWICRAIHLRNHAVVDPGHRKLFINVHAAALVDDADGGRSFAELVRFYGLSPDRVVLEILEPGCGDERSLAAAAAAHRDLGFGIAMDDFGQGCSNLDRIALLRPKIVKIDRAALDGALGQTQAQRVVPAMVRMLRDTGVQIAVKGIDDVQGALEAIEAGVSYLQGFHLGPPSQAPRDDRLARELLQSARRLAAA